VEKSDAAVAPPKQPQPPEAPVDVFDPARATGPLTAAEERALGRDTAYRGKSFRECGACPEMTMLPAGMFMMGSPAEIADPKKEDDKDWPENERPQRQVTIARPFAVGKFEVTFEEWDACVTERGCQHNPHDGWSNKAGWGRGKRPVIGVSWDDITKEYLPWLSRKTGKTYRLLTEAEWEYAARADTITRYAFGDTIAKSQAQFSAVATVERGSFQPNAFGLYDMHGNVWEWVQDCWNASYAGAPSDGSTAWTTGDCGRRVVRGGSWNEDPWYLRSAVRYGFATQDRNITWGFRIGRTL
jgi:formylglycine-generating enzyme required for sulfatase activity